eukprot:CAMPEP_0176016566 /NCGR_PEP_ID=MMETSP0120_2-20121206/7917_1 /TAXON_ID=160619 /ORGANISM="Kryptoperidinium foliaceum, Strain CCMP 1326" /LENGTH=142 /DNA_ID=CAMNT_0017349567 /DNA_START=260 /DNA_END=685 /DNA_ORIENTATION=-
MSTIIVLRLDNLCTLEEVTCSHGWHTNSGGNPVSLALAALWYILTYGTIGHFLAAASAYLGTETDAEMTTLQRVDMLRLTRMDTDGDGIVTKLEFLRDRLIQGGVCSAGDIDTILRNFDELDITRTGFLNHRDVVECESYSS